MTYIKIRRGKCIQIDNIPRSIKARFEFINERLPGSSSFDNFEWAVWGQRFSSSAIAHWYDKLVSQEFNGPMSCIARRVLLVYLGRISNLSEKVLEILDRKRAGKK